MADHIFQEYSSDCVREPIKRQDNIQSVVRIQLVLGEDVLHVKRIVVV